MNKVCLKKIRVLSFVILILMFLFNIPTYSYVIRAYPAIKKDSKTILVVGDSYAGFFSVFESYKKYNILMYAEAGRSTRENYKMMKDAVDEFPDVVLISVGVNDYHKYEMPNDFRHRIEEIVKLCKKRRKRVILYTYMNYNTEGFGDSTKIFDAGDYDYVLRKIAAQYKNAFYIDMSDYNDRKYLLPDGIHYNKLFYDELYRRMDIALMLF